MICLLSTFELKSEVDLYLVMLEPNGEIYDDFGECEIEEEFY